MNRPSLIWGLSGAAQWAEDHVRHSRDYAVELYLRPEGVFVEVEVDADGATVSKGQVVLWQELKGDIAALIERRARYLVQTITRP